MKRDRSPCPRTIALLTDFGLHDNYVGVMKGVILGITPSARLIDICHEIPPGDIRSAAFLLERSWDYFPAETVFLVVVDPGVGGERRGLALRSGESFFVGPDNGVFSAVLERSEKGRLPVHLVSLSEAQYQRPNVSKTFHGRDIFAPAAAHLARGIPVESLGNSVSDPVRFPPICAHRHGEKIEGEVIYVDRFGNLVTSIQAADVEPLLRGGKNPTVFVKGQQAGVIEETYTSVKPGAPLAVVGGFGCLEISINGGSAAAAFGAAIGDGVVVTVGHVGAEKKFPKEKE